MSRRQRGSRQGKAERQAEINALEAELRALEEELNNLPSIEDMENVNQQVQVVFELMGEEGGMLHDPMMLPTYSNRFLTRSG